MDALTSQLTPLLDAGYIPSPLIRTGIRAQLRSRLATLPSPSTSLTAHYAHKMRYVERLRTQPIALHTDKANEQHYEVGTSVLEGMLGKRMKYSSCLYEAEGGKEPGQGGRLKGSLDEAEERMLDLYVQRAGIEDGMEILDLGCGWGSLTLYLAARFPNCRITALSNSSTQKLHIDTVASSQNLSNITVVTADISTHTLPASAYDRILSIELFEHMKNYALLMRAVQAALKPRGRLFVHIFAHRDTPYDFEDGWMAEHFFTGGTMPSADLLLFFTPPGLRVVRQWWVSGMHYAQTCEDWLGTMDRNKGRVVEGLKETYGEGEVVRWWNRWRVFYMACAELFAWGGGDVWGVTHVLWEKE